MAANNSRLEDEKTTFKRRIVVAMVFILLGFMLLGARYAHLQINQHELYQTASENNRIRLQPVAPTRGYIFDRSGIILADNRPVFMAMLQPEIIENDDKLDELLSYLVPIFDLTDEDITQVKSEISKQKNPQPVTLKIDLSDEQMARYAARKPFFKGVYIDNKMTRAYPHGGLFAHVIGYVGRINDKDQQSIKDDELEKRYLGTELIGKLGIENYYEDLLLGDPGYESIETDAYGKMIRPLSREEPIAGNDLTLTLDYGLQKVADEALAGRRGAIVAIDPKDGGVLAFVSNPSYDPNPFITGISFKDYGALRDDIDQPLYNRALQGMYPPASTIKPIEGLGGIHYGIIDWDTKIQDRGYFTLPGDSHRFRDWRKSGHGVVDLDKSIWISCDTFFYQLANKMGIDQFAEWMAQFGFGQKTGIDLPHEKAGILPSREWKMESRGGQWRPGDTISASIGQGYFLATPLQLATATAIMANKGQHITPHLLRSTTGVREHKVITKPDGLIKFNGTETDWDKMHKAMQNVVDIGTGGILRQGLEGYKIAGKTGTAQVKSIAQGKSYNAAALSERQLDHAWFMGFAPADDPQIAVAVIVENGKHGSSTAGPVAKALMDYVVHRMDKDPIEPPPPGQMQQNVAETATSQS